MNGYVAQRRGRFYAVIYEGLDPVTGRERRTWHPAGTYRAAAERLAARLAAEEQGRADAVRALTFGAYLTGQWLPGKKLRLATSTYRGYERNVNRHVIPALGRIGLRRLRHRHIEALCDRLLTHYAERPALSPKTVYEIHLVIRGALEEAVRRGLLTRNVALIARSPRLKAITKTEAQSWTAEQLQQFLRAAAGHQLFSLLWLAGDGPGCAATRFSGSNGTISTSGRRRSHFPRARRRRLRAPPDARQDPQRPPPHRPR